MLEMVDLKKKLAKKEFKKKMPELERRLGELQRACLEKGIPTILVFEGLEASGKGTAINRLMLPLDPRGFRVNPIHPPTDVEQFWPHLIRFWKLLPAKGRLAIFDRSWYDRLLGQRVKKEVSKQDMERTFAEILAFERQQNDDGAVIVKFWMHIGKKEQARRFEDQEHDKFRSWKVGKEEWAQHKLFDKYIAAAEEMMEKTNTARAPWVVVEAHDREYAILKVVETLVATWETALENFENAQKNKAKQVAKLPAHNVTVLSKLDLTQKLPKEKYDVQIDRLQARIRELEYTIYRRRIPVVICYEGCDAAGKGGNIKRLTEHLDPRGYEVIPIAAPTKEELAHHYLWRFANCMPKAGHVTIFDRTWYGRVMVERVEGFCDTAAWQRAFREINEFEAHLANYGAVIVKFWLHIDQQEQLRRFKDRARDKYKQWKLTDEDWRNRKKWPLYETAINDMLANCSTSYAPWNIIESNDKYFARVKALSTVIRAIEKRL
ncbi:MAG TPA: polyphosphate:AMP phosphotransferase [Candidatus Edwardsbacteria bacterium]|nr:polyphosphate:AMP phosphotransferase [Candidatus Edwardsbacteria bacterium]